MCQTLSSKGPFPPNRQLQYQSMCYSAICGPLFTSHHVRASSRSVWFRYFSLGAGLLQCWWVMAVTTLPLPVTCGSCLYSPHWLVLNSCSTRFCVGEAVNFFSLHTSVWWHVVNACCPHCCVFGFFHLLWQMKVRVIILSLSLKANFWITDENNIACIPHVSIHPAI